MTLKYSKVFSAVHTFIIILSFVSSPFAQTTREALEIRQTAAQEPRRTEEEEKAAKELEKKAMALIDELVAEAMSLRRVQNRVYILTVAADLLWAHDEERARALVRDAMDQVVAQMREAKEAAAREGRRSSDSRDHLRNSLQFQHYGLLKLLARRDPKLAMEFLQLTRSLWPDERQEKTVELGLASQVAEIDPQMALRIAERHLDGKLDDRAISFWGALLREDPKAASTLTERIFSDLKSKDILADDDAYQLVDSVLNQLRSSANEIANARNNPAAADDVQPDSTEVLRVYRDALEIVAAAALKITASQLKDVLERRRAYDPLKLIQESLPEIDKHLPSRAQAARANLARLGKAFNLPPVSQKPSWEETENMMVNKSPDELMAMADKSQDESFKSRLYLQTATKLAEQGDPARARRIVKDLLLPGGGMDMEFLSQFLAWIEAKEREQAIKEGKLEVVRNSVLQLRWSEERAWAWIELAATATDQKLQRELLNEASEQLGDQIDTQSQVEAQLKLAAAFLNLEPDRGFEILGSAIDRLNAVRNAEATVTKFNQRMLANTGVVTNHGEVDDEMDVSAWDLRIVTLDQHLLAFARKDFGRTMALLKRSQASGFRLAIYLTLLNRILGAKQGV
ncbi:MAG TPA: hypothetical protein VFV58_12695 [Blastocatellia bacterium]|nr:hypothetical protein [Blastocatellia bacterium]